MFFITTLNLNLAQRIKTGKLSEDQLVDAYNETLKKVRQEEKKYKYIFIGLSIFFTLIYMYAILIDGYNLDIFEVLMVIIVCGIIFYCVQSISIGPIKWQFRRAVKKGYPHLAEQFQFQKKYNF